MGIPRHMLSDQQLAAAGVQVAKQRGSRKVGADRMNGLEKAYAQHLELRRLGGEVKRYRFGSLSLRLADGAWYRTDFFVELADGTVEIHETKGFMQEDARLKLKWAASEYPWPIFVVKKAKDRFIIERVQY